MKQPSEEFYRLIKLFEGCKLEAYKCSANVITIGWGSVLDSKGNPIYMGAKITQAEAELLSENTQRWGCSCPVSCDGQQPGLCSGPGLYRVWLLDGLA